MNPSPAHQHAGFRRRKCAQCFRRELPKIRHDVARVKQRERVAAGGDRRERRGVDMRPERRAHDWIGNGAASARIAPRRLSDRARPARKRSAQAAEILHDNCRRTGNTGRQHQREMKFPRRSERNLPLLAARDPARIRRRNRLLAHIGRDRRRHRSIHVRLERTLDHGALARPCVDCIYRPGSARQHGSHRHFNAPRRTLAPSFRTGGAQRDRNG